jgi:putative PIN family toxin of toxin-antitoxin system
VLVVLDTNVVVAGLRSRRGASFALLRRVGTGAFDIAVSVPLVVEYEDACLRNKADIQLSEQEILDVIDYLCSVARRQPIFFLWRPLLLDPKDDMVAEVAFAAGCDAIVTHNARDFKNAQSLGLRIVDPAELLREIGDQ